MYCIYIEIPFDEYSKSFWFQQNVHLYYYDWKVTTKPTTRIKEKQYQKNATEFQLFILSFDLQLGVE